MKTNRCALIIVLVVSCPAWAELGPTPPVPQQIWLPWMVQSPIEKGEDFDAGIYYCVPQDVEVLPKIFAEVRDYKRLEVVARFLMVNEEAEGHKTTHWNTHFKDAPDLNELRALKKGTYLVALTLETGERVSNVCRMDVVETVAIDEFPVIEAEVLESAPDRACPFIGIRVNASAYFNPEFPIEYSDPNYPQLTIGGEVRQVTCTYHGGLVRMLKPGERFLTVVDPAMFRHPQPTAEGGILELSVRDYAAAPVPFVADRTLGACWDAVVRR